jgi:hypothetical protein
LSASSINDVRQTKIHIAETLVTERSSSEVEIAIEILKSYISPGADQILLEMFQTEGRKARYKKYDY